MGRADNQLVTTRHSCEVKGCNTMTISEKVRDKSRELKLEINTAYIHSNSKFKYSWNFVSALFLYVYIYIITYCIPSHPHGTLYASPITRLGHYMHPQTPAVTIGGTVLKESDVLVILGVTSDSKMTFEKHRRSVSSGRILKQVYNIVSWQPAISPRRVLFIFVSLFIERM